MSDMLDGRSTTLTSLATKLNEQINSFDADNVFRMNLIQTRTDSMHYLISKLTFWVAPNMILYIQIQVSIMR